MTADDEVWRARFSAAIATGQRLSGLYHDNYVVVHGDGRYVVRVPRASLVADVEPRMFAEGDILAALGSGVPAPRLLHRSATPPFLVISRCAGRPLADTHPPGTAVPGALISALAAALRQLYAVDPADLGAPRSESPWTGGATVEHFAGGLLGWLGRVHRGASPAEREFLTSVGLPPEPFAPDLHALSGKARRLRLCHGDLQRPNILGDGGRYHIIDWELAVWGDPVWDVAAHLHRAGYPPGQESEAAAALLGTVPEWAGTAADRQDYAAYLRIERYRSLVLDALRHLRSGSSWSESRRLAAIEEYRRKLAAAELEVPAADLTELHIAHWARDSTA